MLTLKMHFHSSALACCRSGSVQKAGGMCCPRRSGGCPRSGPQKGLGMLSWGSGSRAGAVSGSPFWPTVHVIVTRDAAWRSPIFNHTSMSQISINHLFKWRTSRLWVFGWEGKRQKENLKQELEVVCQLGSGRRLFTARMKDQERSAFSLTHRW